MNAIEYLIYWTLAFLLIFLCVRLYHWFEARPLQQILHEKGYTTFSDRKALRLFLYSDGLVKTHLPPYEYFALVPGVDIKKIDSLATMLIHCANEIKEDKKKWQNLKSSTIKS